MDVLQDKDRIKHGSSRTTIQQANLQKAQVNLMRSIGFIHSPVLYKSIDAAMIAVLRPEQKVTVYLKSLLSFQAPNYERISSMVKLVDRLLPGASRQLSNRLCSDDHLPFAFQDFCLLSYGSGSSVFLIRQAHRLMVLKVYRRSLGRSLKELLFVAREFQAKHAILSDWYNGAFQLVPPALFLVLHGPALGRPATALLQPYISGAKWDLFQDFTDEQILQLMQEDPQLREQFCFFARQTLKVYEQGRCFDFVGRYNLMLTKEDEQYRFVIIDNGIFDLAFLQVNAVDTYRQLQTYIRRLQNLCAGLEPSTV